MITTKRPEDDMIEVAITSMQEALVADGQAVPAGSTPFEREPMDLPVPDPAAGARWRWSPQRWRLRPVPASRPR